MKSTASWKAFATVTASWPIIASMTNSVSTGLTAALMSAACCIISSSTFVRPAVSTMTTPAPRRLASAMASRATGTGSPDSTGA